MSYIKQQIINIYLIQIITRKSIDYKIKRGIGNIDFHIKIGKKQSVPLFSTSTQMKIELKQLSLNDGPEITEMLQEIGPGENGFENSGYDMELKEYLTKYDKQSKWIDLPAWYVAQTIYRLFINEKPVGYGKLRHELTERLLKEWWHIGYSIRPSERGKWYANIILAEILKKATEKKIRKVLLTCNEDNIPSRKVIEKNWWKLENIETKCRYRIDLI